MKTTRITLALLTLFALTGVGYGEIVALDTSYPYEKSFNTGSDYLSNWQVANVTPDGYVNPNKGNGVVGTPFEYAYLNGAEYEDVKETTKPAWEASPTGWISPASSPNSIGHMPNGFYAYKFDLYADLTDVLTDTLSGTLSVTWASDDYIARIFLNGTEIYAKNIDAGSVGTGEQKQWEHLTNKDFSVNLYDNNEFIVVVHNTNAAGTDPKDNSTGLNATFTFNTSIELLVPPQENTPPLTTTPEPATMLIIGLGIAGLGVTRRRMSK